MQICHLHTTVNDWLSLTKKNMFLDDLNKKSTDIYGKRHGNDGVKKLWVKNSEMDVLPCVGQIENLPLLTFSFAFSPKISCTVSSTFFLN